MGNSQSKQSRNKPLAVITGDVHYTRTSLEVADRALRMAVKKANELNVPLIANGDVLDEKAIIRAECANALIETFKLCAVKPLINIGNHSRINEKQPAHALNFLAPYGKLIETPTYIEHLGLYIVPYDHDPVNLESYLATLPKKSTLIMHQGVHGALPGGYILDHSAISKHSLAAQTVILSHYHAHQDISLPEGGLATYIGSPYTVSWGEANDPTKGFLVLYNDNSYDFIPTNLRRHLILEANALEEFVVPTGLTKNDLVWVKFHASSTLIANTTKKDMAEFLGLPCDFKLDLIPTDKKAPERTLDTTILQDAAFDQLIDSYPDVDLERKTRLKSLWRNLV